MIKSRIRIFIVTGLITLAVGIGLFTFLRRDSVETFPATVTRDCAPWDGAAFTVRIPLKDGDAIDISIWKAPDIKFSKTFSFPDNTGQIGNAILIHPVSLPEALRGEVQFEGVSEGKVVEGGFRLKSERGGVFIGIFKAEWESLIALCG